MIRRVAAAVGGAAAAMLAAAALLAQAPAGPAFSGQAPPPESALSLWYREPAADRPLTPRRSGREAAADWVRALPVGNGRLGAMVFGVLAAASVATLAVLFSIELAGRWFVSMLCEDTIAPAPATANAVGGLATGPTPVVA